MKKIKKCSNVKIKLNDPDFISIIKNEISNYYNLDISDIHITNVLDKYLIIDP
jgi:predicted RNA methylase